MKGRHQPSTDLDGVVLHPTVSGRLHDGPVQSLTAGSMWLLLARKRITDPDVLTLLEKAQTAFSEGIRDLRRIMDGPPRTTSATQRTVRPEPPPRKKGGA